MPRTISIPYATRAMARATHPCKLVEFRGLVAMPLVQWCDTGDWGGTFAHRNFDIGGVSVYGDQGMSQPTLTIKQCDDNVRDALQISDLANVRVSVYFADFAAQGAADKTMMGTWALGGVTLGVTETVVGLAHILRFVPQRIVSPAYGFNIATPIGTRIAWGGDFYTMGD